MTITPFRISVPQDDLDELHARLSNTRWPRQLPGERRGVPVDRLQDLAEYWRTRFDWRARERRLNEVPQFITTIDEYDVHFLHARSAVPGAIPLILTHGWPNSFVEFLDTIGPLTERGFDVVVPSIPGFGYSAAPRETGWTAVRVATMWAELMSRLGYERYGVQGGDFGAYVAPEIAKTAPDKVIGVYVISGLGFPTEAATIAKKGVDAKVLTDARSQKLVALAQGNAAKDVANLPNTVKAANAAKNGDLLVKLGENYWGMGKYPDAVNAIKAGIAKGVTNADDAQIALGIAYVGAGQKDAATHAFNAVKGSPAAETVAHIWSVYARTAK